MNDQDTIFFFIKATGPVLPAQVAKHINSNILLASAHLSELSSQGKVKISHLKVGGSPVYYLTEHRDKLQNFQSSFNSKDQEVLGILKERKILRERDLDLLTRVALRKTKDFSIPLNVTVNNNKELFWKWFLIDDSQAIGLIREQLAPEPKIDGAVDSAIFEEQKKPETENEFKKQPETDLAGESEIESNPEKISVGKKVVDEKVEPKIPKPGVDDIVEKIMEKPKLGKKKKPLLQKLKDKLKPKRKEIPDTFFPQINTYFKERNIKIEIKETLRKNSEMDFILKVPSVVGEMTYFCKAKNKKRCDEKDISAAYMEAQAKRYPLLFNTRSFGSKNVPSP